jgi:Protein of unknown function (DUF1186)/SEC-C motif
MQSVGIDFTGERPLEPAAILDQFTHEEEDLPRTALLAASARRAEMVPLFLEEVEKYLTISAAERSKPTPLFFIFHLLGEWRETSAYRPLARLLRSPDDHLDTALGYSTTETAHRIMTAVFDGDPQPIYDIILDAEADEYVRSRMCEALALLVLQDRLDRAEAAAFLRDCWRNLQPRGVCFVWNGWQSAIAMLGLTELREIVKEAFDREIIDPSWLSFHHFESDLELAVSNPTEPLPSHEDEFAPFGDTIEELSKWHCFSEKYRQDQERLRDAPLPPLFGVLSEPIRNPLRGVGRNDPCPCGSGKKFKKCCLDDAESDIGQTESKVWPSLTPT